jgi:uridine kinase
VPRVLVIHSVQELVAEIRARARGRGVFVVALDGRSGTGKSTVAASLGRALGAAAVDCDDFYVGGTDADWAARTPAERADEAIDWRRVRAEVVEPLRAGRTATWVPYDWDEGRGPPTHAITMPPAPTVVLDGAYTARPELADVVDLAVLLELDDDAMRHERVRAREGEELTDSWYAVWDAAQDHYFANVRPRESFAIVLAP